MQRLNELGNLILKARHACHSGGASGSVSRSVPGVGNPGPARASAARSRLPASRV